MTIKECAKIYKELLKKKFVLHIEDGTIIELVFSQRNFKHLLGLHKLEDLPNVTNESSINLYKNSLKDKNNISTKICKSCNYEKIADRVLYFYLVPIILNSKIIVDFDVTKIPSNFKSKLTNTDYILYNRIDLNKVAHLTIVKDSEYYVPETFFVENSNVYLSDQIFLDIEKVEIVSFK